MTNEQWWDMTRGEHRPKPQEPKKRVRRQLSVEKILESFDAKRYEVILFEGNSRVLTIGNCDLVRMSEEVLIAGKRGWLALVFESDKVPCAGGIERDLQVWLAAIKQQG